MQKQRNIARAAILAIWCILCHLTAAAQSHNMPVAGHDTIMLGSGQSVTIYDNGGAYSNYDNSCDGWLTIVSSDGTPLSITGMHFTEYGQDILTLYDGDDHYIVRGSGINTVDTVARTGRLQIHFQSNPINTYMGFSLNVACCDSSALEVTRIAIDTLMPTSATLHWPSGDNEGPWVVQYGSNPRQLVNADTVNVSTVTLTGLRENATTYVGIRQLVGNGSWKCRWKLHQIHTPCSSPYPAKIVYDNLTACYVHPRYGTFEDPDLEDELYDMGSSSPLSHHTVHSDTSERDARTGNALRTIPEGYSTSVRLGNWNTFRQAESISYEYLVDTLNSDLLIMKYAVVMQNPNHSSEEQPRFRFQLLDSTGHEINSQCYSADFVADTALGWNEAPDHVVWKDWTTLGVDLTPLHGQKIHIKMSTYDCSKGEHYGYAYFVFSNTTKALNSSQCGELVENTFTAPEGFRYRWYPAAAPLLTLDTTRQLNVTHPGDYRCQLSFSGNTAGASCSFVMSALAGNRYPTALFDWIVIDSSRCDSVMLRLKNNSVISRDTLHQQLTTIPCESYLWLVDSHLYSTETHPVVTLSYGSHQVELVAMIADGNCSDTLQQQIAITSPSSETLRFDTLVENQLPYFSTIGNTTYSIESLPPTAALPYYDTLFHATTLNQRGCDSLVHHHLHVWRNRRISVDTTLCRNMLPYPWPCGDGILFNDDGNLNTLRDSVTIAAHNGADSTIVMTVHILDNPTLSAHDTLVENALPFSRYGIVFNSDGLAGHNTIPCLLADTLVTLHHPGLCDSLVHYTLHVWPNRRQQIDTTLCDNMLPATWNGVTFALPAESNSNTLYDSILLSTTHGADSLVAMTLHLLRSSSHTRYDTLVENQLPITMGGATFTMADMAQQPSYASLDTTLTTINAASCDSTIYCHLHVWRNRHTVLDSTLCDNMLPIVWEGVTFSLAPHPGASTLLDTILLSTTHGADSMITMSLHILRTTSMERNDTLVQNQLPVVVSGISFDIDSTPAAPFALVADSIWILVNHVGCDSVVHYTLHVWGNVAANLDSTVCDTQLPLVWNGTTFALPEGDDTTTLQLGTAMLNSVHGADSMVTMRLTLLRSSRQEIFDTLVENQMPVSVGGITFGAGSHIVSPGQEQIDTTLVIANTVGCDSTIHYHLVVWRNRHTNLDSTACSNMLPLVWEDVTFGSIGNATTPVVYMDTTQLKSTTHGADSTITYHLTVYAAYEHDDHVVRCYGDTLTYGPLTMQALQDTAADIRYTTHFGCDSLVHLTLQVNPVYHFHDYDTICRKMLPYTWLDTVIIAVGDDPAVTTVSTYLLPRLSHQGCDSTHTLTLVVHPEHYQNVEYVHCDGQELTWEDGVTYRQSTYEPTVTYPNRYGCDSTLRLILNIVDGFDAAMHISPDMVSYEHDEVHFDDISASRRRTWYIDAINSQGSYTVLEDTVRNGLFTYPSDADSVKVLMVAYNAAGCSDSVRGVVHSERGIFWAPNAFTPDESSNNRFNIVGDRLHSGEVWLYDRKGMFVTHFAIDREGWDGTYKGHPCPQGAYTWKLRYSTQSHPRQAREATGTVLLIR